MLCYSGELCLDCGSQLNFKDRRTSTVTIYSQNGSSDLKQKTKVCTKQSCKNHYHYSYFTRKNSYFKENQLAKYYYENTTEKSIFVSSSSTGFLTSFLFSMLVDMLVCPEYSFFTKATAFNLSVSTGNVKLCHKRLSEGFLEFALLQMMNIYQPTIPLPSIAFSFLLDESLLKYTQQLQQLFRRHHAKHSCNVPGCRVVIGWDADCKVRFLSRNNNNILDYIASAPFSNPVLSRRFGDQNVPFLSERSSTMIWALECKRAAYLDRSCTVNFAKIMHSLLTKRKVFIN